MPTCQTCGQDFTPKHSRQKFCSAPCRRQHANHKGEYVCSNCGSQCRTRISTLKTKTTTLCRACASSATVMRIPHPSGPEHPLWRGGSKHWLPGRFGRDADGNHWYTQRSLAWQRDNYTCQKCGVTREIKGPKWKPSVHHIVPWRVSHSHALTNLICLCQSCHIEIESKITDRASSQPCLPAKYPPCRDCGAQTRKLNKRGFCMKCSPQHRDEPTRPRNPKAYCRVCANRIRESLGGVCTKCQRQEDVEYICKLLRQGVRPGDIHDFPHTVVYRYRKLGVEQGLIEDWPEGQRTRMEDHYCKICAKKVHGSVDGLCRICRGMK